MFVPIGFDRNALEYCRDNEAEGARDDNGHSDEAYHAKFPAGKDPQVESKERNLCEAKDGLVEELEEPEVLYIPLVNRCSSKRVGFLSPLIQELGYRRIAEYLLYVDQMNNEPLKEKT